MLTRAITAFDSWQRRHAVAGLPIAVLKKFREDRASRLGALVAYYAFFSLFPALLAFVSILGFVLEDNPSLRDDILDSALGRIPVVGAQIADDVHPLTGSGIALAVGLAGALWAGVGVTVALGEAFADIWDVPREERPGGLKARGRGLALLAALGVVLVGSAVAGRGVALAGSLAALLALFTALTPRPRRLRAMAPGIVAAWLGGIVLQLAGAWYVDLTIAHASATYGTFALVIGLLSWFWVGAQLLLAAVEVNVVLARRLWPRALTGDLEPADRAALRGSAEEARRDDRERIAVTFDP